MTSEVNAMIMVVKLKGLAISRLKREQLGHCKVFYRVFEMILKNKFLNEDVFYRVKLEIFSELIFENKKIKLQV